MIKIFTDKASGKDTNRDGFQEMMKFIREGDIVVVTELKRLGRNNKELTETMNLIQLKSDTGSFKFTSFNRNYG